MEVHDLAEPDVSAFVDFLLPCRNLTTLRIMDSDEQSVPNRVLFLLAETSSPFLGLVEVRVALGQSWEAEILWISRLAPNLKLLAIDPEGGLAYAPSHSIRWAEMTHLRRLIVYGGRDFDPVLRHVISLAPNLRGLSFGLYTNWTPSQTLLDLIRSRDNIDSINVFTAYPNRWTSLNRLLEKGFPLSDNLRSLAFDNGNRGVSHGDHCALSCGRHQADAQSFRWESIPLLPRLGVVTVCGVYKRNLPVAHQSDLGYTTSLAPTVMQTYRSAPELTDVILCEYHLDYSAFIDPGSIASRPGQRYMIKSYTAGDQSFYHLKIVSQGGLPHDVSVAPNGESAISDALLFESGLSITMEELDDIYELAGRDRQWTQGGRGLELPDTAWKLLRKLRDRVTAQELSVSPSGRLDHEGEEGSLNADENLRYEDIHDVSDSDASSRFSD